MKYLVKGGIYGEKNIYKGALILVKWVPNYEDCLG